MSKSLYNRPESGHSGAEPSAGLTCPDKIFLLTTIYLGGVGVGGGTGGTWRPNFWDNPSSSLQGAATLSGSSLSSLGSLINLMCRSRSIFPLIQLIEQKAAPFFTI